MMAGACGCSPAKAVGPGADPVACGRPGAPACVNLSLIAGDRSGRIGGTSEAPYLTHDELRAELV